MAVYITDECISCDACAPECPVAAILSEESDKNPYETLRFYVKPESCVECVGHADAPRCASACPTEGSIVWDMPFIVDFQEHYAAGHQKGTYQIREHKTKGLMLPSVKAQPFIEDIAMTLRQSKANVKA